MGGNLPVGFEATEVIDAHDIAAFEHRSEAGNPPLVTVSRVFIPLVQWVAPTLTGLAEVVGRNPGDMPQLTVRVQVEQMLVGPDIGTVW